MELNPQNAFGEVLLDLIDAQYQGNYDQGVLALMQVTNFPEETIVSIINGDFIVESGQVLTSLMQAFPDADDEDLSIVTTVASGVEESDRGDAEAALQEQQRQQQDEATLQQQQTGEQYATANGGYDVSAAAGEGEAAGGEGAGFAAYAQRANFALQQQADEIAGLKQYVANFANQEQLSRRLDRLSAQAAQLQEGGLMPPAYKRMLIGDFSNSEQRVARFTRMAQENGVDVPTMLFASEYALNLLGRGGQYVEFQDYSVSSEDANVANFNANLDAVVAEDFAAIFGS